MSTYLPETLSFQSGWRSVKVCRMSHSLQSTYLRTGLHTADFLFTFQLFAQKCFFMCLWSRESNFHVAQKSNPFIFQIKVTFLSFSLSQPVTTVKLDGWKVSPSQQQQWLIKNNGWKTKFKCYIWLRRQQYSHAIVDMHVEISSNFSWPQCSSKLLAKLF